MVGGGERAPERLDPSERATARKKEEQNMVKSGSYRQIETLALLVVGLLLAALVTGCGARGGGEAGGGGGENGEEQTYKIQLSHVVAPDCMACNSSSSP
jgi:hypothetical protein